MKIVGDKAELMPHEAAALNSLQVVSLGSVALYGLNCPWTRYRQLSDEIAVLESDRQLDAFIQAITGTSPNALEIGRLDRQRNIVGSIAGRVLVYEIEAHFGMPHEAAPPPDYDL